MQPSRQTRLEDQEYWAAKPYHQLQSSDPHNDWQRVHDPNRKPLWAVDTRSSAAQHHSGMYREARSTLQDCLHGTMGAIQEPLWNGTTLAAPPTVGTRLADHEQLNRTADEMRKRSYSAEPLWTASYTARPAGLPSAAERPRGRRRFDFLFQTTLRLEHPGEEGNNEECSNGAFTREIEVDEALARMGNHRCGYSSQYTRGDEFQETKFDRTHDHHPWYLADEGDRFAQQRCDTCIRRIPTQQSSCDIDLSAQPVHASPLPLFYKASRRATLPSELGVEELVRNDNASEHGISPCDGCHRILDNAGLSEDLQQTALNNEAISFRPHVRSSTSTENRLGTPILRRQGAKLEDHITSVEQCCWPASEPQHAYMLRSHSEACLRVPDAVSEDARHFDPNSLELRTDDSGPNEDVREQCCLHASELQHAQQVRSNCETSKRAEDLQHFVDDAEVKLRVLDVGHDEDACDDQVERLGQIRPGSNDESMKPSNGDAWWRRSQTEDFRQASAGKLPPMIRAGKLPNMRETKDDAGQRFMCEMNELSHSLRRSCSSLNVYDQQEPISDTHGTGNVNWPHLRRRAPKLCAVLDRLERECETLAQAVGPSPYYAR